MANEDPAYLAFVRSLPCAMHLHDPCDGPVEAHHTGPRGLSQRAHDRTAVPLCRYHHACRHAANGPFKRFKKADFRRWSEFHARRARKRWEDTLLEDRLKVCPECGELGHDLADCPYHVAIERTKNLQEEKMSTRPGKAWARRRSCTHCGGIDHDRRNCRARRERRAMIEQRAKAQEEPRDE